MPTTRRRSTDSWCDDFVIVTGGETISGRENFKRWIAGFLDKVDDLHLEVLESFQNADGSRVASRWLLTGKNNGFLGTAPDRAGHRDDRHRGMGGARGRKSCSPIPWVERASWERFQRLRGDERRRFGSSRRSGRASCPVRRGTAVSVGGLLKDACAARVFHRMVVRRGRRRWPR